MIKELNILIKFGKASIAGFRGSLFIMQQPSASAGKEGKGLFFVFCFCQCTAPPIHLFSLHKLPLFNISRLIYDCRSYLIVPCGVMVACTQEKISKS